MEMQPASVSKDKKKILIVDDEPVNLAVLIEILKPQYSVRVANSGYRALDIVNSQPRPELILLDVVMPGIDGYEVLSRIKSTPETADIPVIFVTAKNATTDEKIGFALGAVDYITKPVSPDILLGRVKSHLMIKNARDFLSDKNEFLESEISRRLRENQVVQDISIRALAHLAETRDNESGHHILRTQGYVRILAEQLQHNPRFKNIIDNHYIDLVSKSAPLHDIGKVGIPDSILLKPGKLTPEERKIMETHTTLGVQAIEASERDVEQNVDFLVLAKEIVQFHHERWDGKGYPKGLRGEEIPVSARLMALADVFDALISKRVYKEEFSLEQAKKIILNGRGTQFDPDVTDAFETCYDQFVSMARKFKEA